MRGYGLEGGEDPLGLHSSWLPVSGRWEKREGLGWSEMRGRVGRPANCPLMVLHQAGSVGKGKARERLMAQVISDG